VPESRGVAVHATVAAPQRFSRYKRLGGWRGAQGALAIVGMPINVLPIDTIGRILAAGQSVCAAAGIPIAGGHSIDSVEPIYGLVVLGIAHPDRIRRNSAAQVGDALVLGKPIGVGIYSAALKKDLLDAAGYARMVSPATQLNTPGPALAAHAAVHAITDITGFGLAGHTLELCRGAGLAARLSMSSVPVLPNALDIFKTHGFDQACVVGKVLPPPAGASLYVDR